MTGPQLLTHFQAAFLSEKHQSLNSPLFLSTASNSPLIIQQTRASKTRLTNFIRSFISTSSNNYSCSSAQYTLILSAWNIRFNQSVSRSETRTSCNLQFIGHLPFFQHNSRLKLNTFASFQQLQSYQSSRGRLRNNKTLALDQAGLRARRWGNQKITKKSNNVKDISKHAIV